MMIPITLRSTEEFLLAVPRALREAAMALGASKWKTISTVIVPAAYRGILTAVLLAFARVRERPRHCYSPPSEIAFGVPAGLSRRPHCRS